MSSATPFLRRIRGDRAAVPVACAGSVLVVALILASLGPVVALSVSGGLVEILGIAITTGWLHIPRDWTILGQDVIDYLTNVTKVRAPAATAHWWPPPTFRAEHEWLRRAWAMPRQ